MKRNEHSQEPEFSVPFGLSPKLAREAAYTSDPNHHHRQTFGVPGDSPSTLNNPERTDEDASSAIESVGILTKESVRNGLLTNPFTVSEEELLVGGGGRLHSDFSEGSPLIRMKESFSARRSPTLMKRMAARSPEWRRELKIPIIKPISTKSPSNYSNRPTVRSSFSPQRKESGANGEQKSMILKSSTTPKQISTVRRNSSTSGVIVEEDLINSSQEMEPELESIIDLEPYKQNSQLVESLKSKKYKDLFDKRGSPIEGNLVAELKELLIETIEENRTLKAQKAFEEAIRVEDSSLTESPSPKAPSRNNNSDSQLKHQKKSLRRAVNASLQVLPPRASKKNTANKTVNRTNKRNPRNEESVYSRSSCRSKGAVRESDLESSRLENKEVLMQRQLKEKDEIINRIMLDSYQKAQHIASMQRQIERSRDNSDERSELRQMRREWSQRTTQKDIIESHTASRASRAPSHRTFNEFKIDSPSERMDGNVDQQILHLAQNYASLAQNLQRELEGSQRMLVQKDQRIKEILYRDSLLSSELHQKNMKIVSLRSERHKLKEAHVELKENLAQMEQKYRMLKKRVYSKLKEKNQQIIQLKDVLKYYNHSGLQRETVCASCVGRASTAAGIAESPYMKYKERGEVITKSKLPRASISTIGLSEDRENLSSNRPKYAKLYDPDKDYTPGQFSKTTFYPQSETSLPTRRHESTRVQASQRLKDILDEAVFLTKLAGLGEESQEQQIYSENPFQRGSSRHFSNSLQIGISDRNRRDGESKTETELSRTLGVVNPQSFEEASNRFVSVSMFDESPGLAESSATQHQDDELGKLLRSNSSSSVQSYQEGRREVGQKQSIQFIELKAARSQVEGNHSLLQLELSDKKAFKTPKRMTKHSRAFTAAAKKLTRT